MKSFSELEQYIKGKKRKTLVIAAADEKHVLETASRIIEADLADLILVGGEVFIREHLKKGNFKVVDEKDPARATEKAFELLCSNEADAIMKGLVQTDIYLKALLKRKEQLLSSKLLSHIALTEFKGRFLIITDVAINVEPDLEQKIEIIKNAVKVARNIGFAKPKVALICPTEKVNPKIECTMEAAVISKMAERGDLGIEAEIDGPMALDVALSAEAAEIKKVKSFTNVKGQADIIVLDSLTDGNAVYKALEIFLDAPRAAVIAGIKHPAILTSRSDSSEIKYNSVLFALSQSEENEAV